MTSPSESEERLSHILAAAERRFLAFGMRRTSMDDIAQEAGLAKGTLYLSFKSKEVLFANLVQRMMERYHIQATAASKSENSPENKVAAYLNEAIGEPARLLAETPHVSELLDTKKVLAASTIAEFQEQIRTDITTMTGGDEDLTEMIIEAAYGCKSTGALDVENYTRRLHRHVKTLLCGAMLS